MQTISLPSFSVEFKEDGIHVTHTKTKAKFVLNFSEFERWLSSKLRGKI